MSGIIESFPENAIAIVVFIIAVIYLCIQHRKDKKSSANAVSEDKQLKDSVRELIHEIKADRNERDKSKES